MDWIVSVEILRIVSLNLSTTLFKEGNLLDRNFDQAKPNQFWVTDITYIPIPGNMLYMCAVLDLCGKVVLAWKIGTNMSNRGFEASLQSYTSCVSDAHRFHRIRYCCGVSFLLQPHRIARCR